MPDFQTAELSDRGVVKIKGGDARKLLQGLITNDLDPISPGSALFAGLLSPQGKILFDFFVVPTNDGFLIDVARDSIPDFIKRLTLYRLRADVSLEDVSSTTKVIVGWGDTSVDHSTFTGSLTVADPRHGELGVRSYMSTDQVFTATSSIADYHKHRIALGVPEGGQDYEYSDTYPHEALYDDLHGVSFTKGCFIGQEVVSRMEHRNATKKRIVKVLGRASLPASGTEISAGQIALGRLGSSAGKNGLALIRVDRIKDVVKRGDTPTAQSIDLEFSKPEWATFDYE